MARYTRYGRFWPVSNTHLSKALKPYFKTYVLCTDRVQPACTQDSTLSVHRIAHLPVHRIFYRKLLLSFVVEFEFARVLHALFFEAHKKQSHTVQAGSR